MKSSSHPAAFAGTLLAALAVCAGASADTLTFRNGKVLKGVYRGGDSGSVRFETENGSLTVPLFDVASLSVTDRMAPSMSTDTAASPAMVVIPAGTTVLVRTQDTIFSTDPVGKRFTATLQSELVADGRSVVPSGTTVYGTIDSAQFAGRQSGRPEFLLSLREINLGGTAIPIATSNFIENGQSSFGQAARGAPIVEGHDGMQNATATSMPSMQQQGEKVTVPAGTLLEFRLTQSLSLKTK